MRNKNKNKNESTIYESKSNMLYAKNTSLY